MATHSDEAKAAFRGHVPDHASITVKPMVGSVGAFVGGHMFAGLFGEVFGVKLDAEGTAEAEALPGAGPFGPESRPMNGWVGLPRNLPDAEYDGWFERAFQHLAAQPPKEAKTTRAKKA